MTQGKGAPRYATLPVRDLVPVQVAHLRTRFELAERSFLAEQAAMLTNQALARWEAEQGIRRLRPGECLVRRNGQPVALPLLSGPWTQRLAEGLSVAAVRRHLELEQLQALCRVSWSELDGVDRTQLVGIEGFLIKAFAEPVAL